MPIWAEMQQMPAGEMLGAKSCRYTVDIAHDFSVGVGQHNCKCGVHAPGHDEKTCLEVAPSGKGSCPLGLRHKALLLFDAVHLKLLLLLSFTHLHRHSTQRCAGRAGALAGN